MAIITTAATAYGVANKLGFKPANALKGIFREKNTDCGEKQRQVENIFKQYLSPADLENIANEFERKRVGKLRGRTIRALAMNYSGGDDCRVTTSRGKAWVAYVDNLINQRAAELEARQEPFKLFSNEKPNKGTTLSGLNISNMILPVLLVAGLSITFFKR